MTIFAFVDLDRVIVINLLTFLLTFVLVHVLVAFLEKYNFFSVCVFVTVSKPHVLLDQHLPFTSDWLICFVVFPTPLMILLESQMLMWSTLGFNCQMCFSLAGYTHRDALVHLQTQFCDWLAGGAHRDEDVLFQCRHAGGHEQLGQGYEPGCPDADTDCEEVSV